MPTKSIHALVLVVWTLFFCANLHAQTVIRAAPMTRAIPLSNSTNSSVVPATANQVNANPAGSVEGSNPGAESPPAEETPEQKKLKLVMEQSFDRTTGAMLKEWSTEPEDETDPAKTDEQPRFEAIVKNAFEDFAVLQFEKTEKLKANDIVIIKADKAEFGKWKLLSIDGAKVSAQKVKTNAGSNTTGKSDSAKSSKSSTTKEQGDDSDNQQNEPAAQSNPAAVSSQKQTKEDSTQATDSKSEEQRPAADSNTLKVGLKVVLTHAKTGNKKPDVDKQIEREVKSFARSVALGEWGKVKPFLAKFNESNANKVYGHLLRSLATVKRQPGVQPPRGQQPPKPHLSPNDILELANASPSLIEINTGKNDQDKTTGEATNVSKLPPGVSLPPGISVQNLPPEALQAISAQSGTVPGTSVQPKSATGKSTANHISALATLMRNAKTAGHDFKRFHETIKKGTRHFGGEDPIKRLTAAELFMQSGMTEYVEEFLPELDDSKTQNNLAALKIWSRYALSMNSKKRMAAWRDKAWQINQWILAIEEIEKPDKDTALSNLISLSSKIDQEIGVQWVNESFTDSPQRGMTILTNLGTKSAEMALKAAQTAESTRFDLLRLQNEAVEKLIAIAPDQATQWKSALTLLAQNWLTEAATSLQFSQQNGGREYMQIDMYGNYYWINSAQRQQMFGGNNRRPRPIKIGDILEIAPSSKWQAIVDPTLHTSMRQAKANLHLRINEEDKAFPYIEEIAKSDPEMARDLVHEFLRIWTQNHDPNSNKRQRNPYIYFYGFDQKAEAIPLTRSKQERNLEELQGWVDRIRQLPIDDIDETKLANAFTTCHSSAEVFKLERFRAVFGELKDLKPETIAAICEKMRANLSSNWRDIRNQEQKQTKRREPEVQKEVLEGYDTGMALCSESLSASPDNWKLHLVKAKLMFDQNAYSQTVQKSSEFSDKRDSAFEQFEIAASKYQSIVGTLEEKDQSTDVYDYWFYASLGAVDLGKITDKTVPDLRQYSKIRNAIEALSPELSQWHMSKFANNLFTRMSPIKPEIKFRYLRGGFQIVGDHPRAWEAKSLFDYYKDLVSEIKLVVSLDGEDKVGHEQPFGVYVNILHTNEIERESGGFGKYVQNQNSMIYAFNYGRPTENYRDKFNDSVEMALGEHFEVLNVTFQSADSMKSRPGPKLGWRVTPYAYVLLRPKGPEIDRIAPLKLDLDFLDTSGYVVIPVESPALVVDCSNEKVPMRPVKDLEITQTLDERQADDGKLIVEIAASAKGLVPDLDEIINLKRDDFEIVSVDDQGVLPTSFDKEAQDIQILSDRSWTVEYKAKESDDTIINFAFSDPKIENTVSKFQRYEDADLVEVAQSVQLEKRYDSTSYAFLYWLLPLVFVAIVGLTGLIYINNQPQQVATKRFEVPDEVNPFTVLTLLKDIKARNGISQEQGLELQNSIDRIEKFYFSESKELQPADLEEIAVNWVRQAT